MASPPAWSIGTGKRSTDWKSGTSLGPGAYNARLSHKHAAPSWRLGTASRSVDNRNEIPGPGSYNSPGKISTTSPQYGFGLKSPSQDKGFTPGPGAYNGTGLRGYDQTAPSFSFRAKTNVPDGRTRVPGPGTYDQNSRIQNQTSPGYRIGTSQRSGLYNTGANPGPGTYSTRPNSAFNRDSGPKYGFGSAERSGLEGMSKTLPGPGAYNFRGEFESPGKGTSLVPRRPDSAMLSASRSPGPGAYNPSLSTKNQNPSYRIGSASRDGLGNRNGTPGPGNYDPRAVSGNQNVKIGTSTRSPLSTNNKVPGPGSYQHNPKVGEGPRYIINPRREDNSKSYTKYVPGPGAYTPSVELVKHTGPNVGIGTSNRYDLHPTKANPGPGQYDTRGRLVGPKWGFGSEPRGKDYKSAVPGPGSYNPPSAIADVPKYVFGSAPLKIHL